MINDASGKKTKVLAIIITEQCAVDIYRRRKRLGEVEWDDNAFITFEESIYTGDNLLTAQIFKLNVKYRNVLILKYVQGYAYSEIAKLLNISEDNARKIAQRAKAKLEVLCKEQGLL